MADSSMSYSEKLTRPTEKIDESNVKAIRAKKDNNKYSGLTAAEIGTDYTFKWEVKWKKALAFLVAHLAAFYGFWLTIFDCYWLTNVWIFALYIFIGLGISAGAHRLFSHGSYNKASFIVRAVLVMLQTMAGQISLYAWVRVHRQHHKYSDTDADPHNANRGFFFSHIGWLLSKQHPAVLTKRWTIDMSDLEADSVVMFQKKHYKILYTVFGFLLPTLVPVYGWGESWWNSFFAVYIFRNVLIYNVSFLINSAAHYYGNKPFDKFIRPIESAFLSLTSWGDGWHNYHHTFPWDYRTSEFGTKYNLATTFIDVLYYFGLAYDLKTTPDHIVQKRCQRTGDGSHPVYRKSSVK